MPNNRRIPSFTEERNLAAQGCRLALVDVNEDQLQNVAAELACDQVQVSVHCVDVSDREQMARAIQRNRARALIGRGMRLLDLGKRLLPVAFDRILARNLEQ